MLYSFLFLTSWWCSCHTALPPVSSKWHTPDGSPALVLDWIASGLYVPLHKGAVSQEKVPITLQWHSLQPKNQKGSESKRVRQHFHVFFYRHSNEFNKIIDKQKQSIAKTIDLSMIKWIKWQSHLVVSISLQQQRENCQQMLVNKHSSIHLHAGQQQRPHTWLDSNFEFKINK